MVTFTAFLVTSLMALPPAAPRVLRTFQLGGEGRWDYVNLDPEAGRLFVPRSTRVMVLDLDGKAVGEIPDTQGVHGVAFDPGTGCAYASNGEGTLTVIRRNDAGAYEVAATVATRKGARTIVDNPRTHRLYLPTAAFEPLAVDAKPGTRPAMVKDSFKVIEVGY